MQFGSVTVVLIHINVLLSMILRHGANFFLVQTSWSDPVYLVAGLYLNYTDQPMVQEDFINVYMQYI